MKEPSGFQSTLRVRCIASAIHLSSSLAVAAIAAVVVFVLWYPVPYRDISGGRNLFLLVVAVDVVLGPCITLVIFDRRKRVTELRRDMAIVVLLQLAALAYGLNSVAEARPVYLVHEINRFRVVKAIDISAAELADARPELRRLPWTGPGLLGVLMPTNAGEQMRSIELALAGRDLGTLPQYWRPYEEVRSNVLTNAKPLTSLRATAGSRAMEIDEFVARSGHAIEDLAFVPILGRSSNWSAVVDRSSAALLGFLPFDGF